MDVGIEVLVDSLSRKQFDARDGKKSPRTVDEYEYVKNSNPDLSVVVADGGPMESFDLSVLRGSFKLMIWSGNQDLLTLADSRAVLGRWAGQLAPGGLIVIRMHRWK